MGQFAKIMSIPRARFHWENCAEYRHSSLSWFAASHEEHVHRDINQVIILVDKSGK